VQIERKDTNKILYFIGKDPIKTYTICNVAAQKDYKYICFYDKQKRCKNGRRKRRRRINWNIYLKLFYNF